MVLSMNKYKKGDGENYKQGLTSKESLLISILAREDKKIFSINDARCVIEKDTKKTMSSLIRKKWVLPLKRGLYAIVPLEAGIKGADSFILHNFIIASYLAEPYYIGYWSALNHYGFSEQIPRTTFVATTKAKNPMEIMNANYYFVGIEKKKFFGFNEVEMEGRKVNISSPEKTIADCLDHPEHSGGIEEVARAIYFNHEEINLKRVYSLAKSMGNMTILKRLGYLLEITNLLENYKDLLGQFSPSMGYPALDPLSPKKGKHISRWGLLVNFELNPNRWIY